MAVAQCPCRAYAACFAAAHGSLRAGRADRQHATRERRACRRARVAGESARRYVRVWHALRGRGRQGADLARARSRRSSRARAIAGDAGRALSAARPQRARGGDPGRRGCAIATARVLHHPAGASSVSRERGLAFALGLALAFSLVLGGPVATARLPRGASHVSAGRVKRIETAAPAKTPASGTASFVKTAPSGPPLSSPSAGGGAEGAAGVQSLEGDQLVENGLSSPLCEAGKALALSSVAQSNCQTSGFVAAPAPTNNYDLDVNIDTGTLGLSNGQLLSVIQDVFVAPIWEGLVWLVHALVVMLQWCYTLELLGGSMTSGLRSSLREAQTSFTQPWLALVLAVASALAFYNGLIRRRIGEALGQALLTIAMMAAGLWLIADPLGTVGAVGRFANQASLGTLGAVAQGSTANAPRTLGDSMRALFASAIEVPWCYLEFGDVRWCSDPAMLEPRLRKAASRIVSSERAKLSCRASSPCRFSLKSSVLTHESELVGKADTNGALFLAFPANGPERNSSKDESSLLHVLCQSESDSKCKGATATQEEC